MSFNLSSENSSPLSENLERDGVRENLPQESFDYFLKYQIGWITDQCQISVRDKSRRTGGTETVAFEALLWGLETKMKSKDVWFTSADKKAAEEFIVAVKFWCKVFQTVAEAVDEEIINPDNEEDFFLKFEVRIPLGDGSILRVHALSSNVNSFHGKQGFMIVDEMARHKDQVGVWEGAFPATIWGYPLRVISTQNGKGLFYQLCEACKKGKHPDWGYHHTDIYEAVADGLYDKIAIGKGLIQPGEVTTEEQRMEWIESIRKNCLTDTVFNQQFLCKAEDDEAAFLDYPLIGTCEADCLLTPSDDSLLPLLNKERAGVRSHWIGDTITGGPENKNNKWVFDLVDKFTEWFNTQKIDGSLFVGVDIGRTKDLTVIWVDEKIFDLKIARMIIILDRMPYWVQKLVLFAILQHKKIMRCCIDSTGKGENLAEDCHDKFGSTVEGIWFTNKIKETMAEKLKASFQDKTTRIPFDPVLRADLHSVKKETTAAGNTRLAVNKEVDEEGNEIGHADRFWAKALAHHADDGSAGPIKTRTGNERAVKKLLSDHPSEGYYPGIVLFIIPLYQEGWALARGVFLVVAKNAKIGILLNLPPNAHKSLWWRPGFLSTEPRIFKPL